MKIAILGGGLTGLTLGKMFNQSGKDFVIFEKEPQVGGLCRTNKTGNYRWDFGVHAVYSRSKEAMDYFCSFPFDYQHSQRNVKIMHYGEGNKRYLIDYPFENGVRQLPLKDKIECIAGYILARVQKRDFKNLQEWIDKRLGFGVAKHFMTPYNNKIWNCRLSDISEYLVSSKIEPATAVEFIKNALWKRGIGREYQANFIYPRNGIQELCDYSASAITGKILLNTSVERLSRKDDKWVVNLSSRDAIEADLVISTIPLVELLKKINIEGIKKEYEELRWNNTFFVMVGLKDGCRFNLINNCHWVFYKGKEAFYRLTLMHNFSSKFPVALVAEVTRKGSVSDKENAEIEQAVINDLLRFEIIRGKDDIARSDIKYVEYTYPIPTVGLENLKEKISTILKSYNLFLLGRNGNWDYINMDGVALKVKEFSQMFQRPSSI